MKTIKYILLGGMALVAATSCSDDFLEVESPTQIPYEEYFTTDEHVYEALIATYDPLQWPDWSNNQYNPVCLMSDIMADDIWVGGSDKNDNQYWHLMMNYEALPTNCMSGLWSVAYTGVKRANDVLQYLEWAKENMTQEHQTRYAVEARVLRAFYYNWLWKFWGNIPYYEQNLSYPYICAQSTADEVYDSMIKDLEGAIELNVLPMKAASGKEGFVTKAFAYMLYAEVVMYQKDESRYAKALQYMKEIIASGEYILNPNYAEIFTTAGEWCSESIFEINYTDQNAVRSWGWPYAAGGTVLPRLISPTGWNDGTAGHENGWGFCPVRQETYDLYAAGDTRRDATCWNAAAAGSYKARYQDTGFFLEKYVAKAGGNAGQLADADLNYNNNLRIYRYAETLLNAAELAVRTGDAAEAKTWLNMVHNRAGLTDQVDATVENIINERHLEFVGEGKRYWDLVRCDLAAQTLVPDTYGYRTNTWSASKKYLPIPQSEIDAAQNTLTQNNY